MIRQLLQKRPLAVALAVYLLSAFLIGYLLPRTILFVIPIGILALVFFLSCLKSKRLRGLKPYRTALLLLTLSLALSTAIGCPLNAKRQKTALAFDEYEGFATFYVTSITEYDDVTITSGILTPENSDERYRTRLYFFGETLILVEEERYLPLTEGDIIRGCFSLSAIKGDTLDSLQQYADGYDLTGSYLHSAERIGQSSRLPSWQKPLSILLDEKLSHYGSGMMKALLLADKRDLTQEIKENFSTLGTSHLLAVSGLHLTILIGMIAHVLTRLSLDRRIAYPILATLVVLYAILTNFTPSLLRAGGMLLLFYLSGFAKRQRDSVTALFAATALIVTISPRSILDLGLLFSFLATLGILLVASPLTASLFKRPFWQRESHGITKALKQGLRTLVSTSVLTISATAFILPISLLISGEVFLLAPFSNLIFAPLFTLLLWLLPLFLITAKIPLIGQIVAFLIELVSMLIASLSYLAEAVKPFLLSLGYDFMPYLVLILGIAAIALLLFQKRLTAFLVLASFLLLAPIGVMIDDTTLKHQESVSYLSNGKNDLLFVEYEKSRLAIVFSASQSFAKTTIEKSALSSPSVAFDTLFLPSPTNAHALLIYELWENGGLTHLILPSNRPGSLYLENFAKSLGITVTCYMPNDTIVYNGIAITTYKSSQDTTLAVSVKTTKQTLLYLQENAPNDFDIRFGVMQEPFDTVILGTYGNETKSSLILNANEVWEYERRGCIVPQKNQTYRYGNRILTDKREKQQ